MALRLAKTACWANQPRPRILSLAHKFISWLNQAYNVPTIIPPLIPTSISSIKVQTINYMLVRGHGSRAYQGSKALELSRRGLK